ncbi:NBU/pMV158-type mobilization protein, partial [Bacteroides uniformis]
LQDLAEKLEERFGVHAFQIYTHKDEGANVWDGKEEAWKPNYHAHMIFDWTDGHTGKTVKLNRHDMAEMQTITAECLNMERGVSSDKKHLSAMQYKNKMETEKAEQLQKDIEQLNRAYTAGTEKITTVQKELSTAQKELNSMKTDIHINEAKEAAAKAGKTVFNAVTSVFNVGEVKRQAKEIETLKKENYNLSFKNQNLEGQLRTNNIEMRRVQETTDRQIKAEASKLKPITNLFPEMENAQENIEELQTMGIQNKDIRQLLIGKEIYYTGNLYDKDKRKSYQVKNVKIDISKSQNGITTIWLNNIHFKNFLKELWNTLQKTLDNGNWLHR